MADTQATANIITQIQFIDTFGKTGPQGIITVDTGTQFAINYAVSDIKDPFSRKGVKSYKFNIVGTKEVNQLLNNYYDINIVDGTYNSNHKQKVAVLRNGVVIVDNAYMQLMAINKISTSDVYSDGMVSYDVEVGNDTTSFFTDITNKYLSDLDMSDMNHVYDSTNVVDSFDFSAIRNNTLGTGGYKYVLPYTSLDKYLLEECKPAISVYEYWDRIHKNAGYQWSWVGYNNSRFRMNKLYIPYNGEKPQMHDQQTYKVAAERTTDFTLSGAYSLGSGLARSQAPSQFICDIELQDDHNDYDPVTGWWTSTFNTGASAVDVTFRVSYEFYLDNPQMTDAYLMLASASGAGIHFPTVDMSQAWDLYCIAFNNTLPAASTNGVFATESVTTTPTVPATLVPGLNLIATGTMDTPIIPVTGISVGDVLETRAGINGINQSFLLKWYLSTSGSGSPVTVNPVCKITNIQMILIPRIDTYGYGVTVDMNDFVPQKIKQSDFVKSIANMYNLMIDIDPSNDRKIIYTQRDDYYDNGAQKNWTGKLNTNKQNIIEPISKTNSKKIVLTYKEDKDLANVTYQTDTKEIYGQLEYELQNENIKGLDKKEIIFSPSPIMYSPLIGTYNPYWDGMAPKVNLRVLFDGGEQDTDIAPYDIIDYISYGVEYSDAGFGLTTYPMMTHMDDPNEPSFDINFGLCDKYYFPFLTQTNNNLFSMYWSRTIGQIDSGKLWTAYFDLDEYDISVMKLNDKIFIKDSWYNINSLQYDPNSTGPTKAVLMTVDDRLKITSPKLVGHAASSSSAYAVAGVLADSTLLSNWNTVYATDSVMVLGRGNVLTSKTKNAIVVGDNRMNVQSDTIYTENLDIAGNLTINGISLPASEIVGLWVRDNDDIVAQQNPDTLVDPMVLPFTDDASDIGSAAFQWRNIYLTTAIIFPDDMTVGYRTGTVGTASVVLGGSALQPNTASSDYALVSGGNNIASGAYSFCMGQDSQVSGLHAVGLGNTVTASGEKSMATGGHAIASHYGEYARSSFFISGSGDAQHGDVQYGRVTTNATITELFLDGPAASQRFTLQQNTAYAVEIRALAIDTATMDSAMWTGKGIVKNVAGVTSLVAAIVPTQDQADASMAATVLTVTADNGNDSLKIEGTGIAATTIRWNVTVSYTKLTP